VTARTGADVTPENIVRKVSDASGSKYGGDSMPGGIASPIAFKAVPAFMPTSLGGRGGRTVSRTGAGVGDPSTLDSDGWGVDAPQITRSTLEKVQSAYKPTRVNMADLTSQRQEPSRFQGRDSSDNSNSDVVRGGYQPIGKIDIAAIRREAQAAGSAADDRPAPVKGSYEPIGKVDIAAIRAKAQKPGNSTTETPKASVAVETDNEQAPRSLADRSAVFTNSERITAMPKPKVLNRFGDSMSNFSGTRAPAPTPYGVGTTIEKAAPIGVASRTFADEGGKTPAQIWAEKKARERDPSGAGEASRPSNGSPLASQTSGRDGFQSSYSGKSWAPVSTTRTGQSTSEQTEDQEPQEPSSPDGDIRAIRDRFSTTAPMGRPDVPNQNTSSTVPPPMDLASKPRGGISGGVAMPGLPSRAPKFEPDGDRDDEEIPAEETTRMPTPPAQPPRSPSPETPNIESAGSPIRLAMPIGRTQEKALEPAEQRVPAMPVRSLANAVPAAEELEDEPELEEEDPARGAGAAMAVSSFGTNAAGAAGPGASIAGKSAVVQYDYEKAEDNELELKEGETVSNIEMVDEDWWMGTNPRGESGLFPSNYVELVEGGADPASAAHTALSAPAAVISTAASPAGGANKAATATAQFDYEAAEENELSFPEGATIENIVCSRHDHAAKLYY